ncbi:MAG: protein kinase, partial [Deltaproteobacteria bacterium]|nr:protein kinase [Deltaproteobacteria bacterium]
MIDRGGERVGAYRLEAQLGRGGMGVVYRARSPDGGVVALKRLELADATDESLTRFLREASLRIRHPNVVRVVGAGADSAGRPYLVMELLEGEPLDRVLSRGLPVRRVVEIAIAVCSGLEALHGAGLVHRDVKPSNIFVCTDGTPKLLDLGIAFSTQGATMITQSGSVVGTPAYLAPEQARGRRVDVRADVWSVGVLLYEGLTGVNPFRRDTQLATMLAVVAEPIPALAAQRRPVARRLARIVERCLVKDPEGRLHSITALREALERYLEEHDDAVAVGGEDAASEGERRVVAVLIAEGVERVEELSRAIVEAGGETLPLAGARVAGIFGADTSRGDELRRALDAAFEARAAARGMAIACGHATRRGALVSGEALAEAERAAQHAIGAIVAGPATVPMLTPYAEVLERSAGVFEVVARKATTGRASPVRGHVAGASHEPPPQTGGGSETPLVGRATELAAIERSRDVWRDEQRAVAVLVSGPLGIGKSRLADAAVELFRGAGTEVVVRSARADDRGMPVAFSLIRG